MPGEVVVREGDAGDRFYIVTEGEVDVTEAGKPLSTLAAGGYFGEIALLRDMPRTATVTARTPVVLYALDREDFLAAVTSHAPSEQAAEEVVSARLAGVAHADARAATGARDEADRPAGLEHCPLDVVERAIALAARGRAQLVDGHAVAGEVLA